MPWTQDGALLLPQQLNTSRRRLLQDLAAVWPEVVLPLRYLGAPKAAVCGVTVFGRGVISAAAVVAVPGHSGASGRPRRTVRPTVAVPGHTGASDRPRRTVRPTVTVPTAAAAAAAITAAAAVAAAATAAAVTIAVAAAIFVTA